MDEGLGVSLKGKMYIYGADGVVVVVKNKKGYI